MDQTEAFGKSYEANARSLNNLDGAVAWENVIVCSSWSARNQLAGRHMCSAFKGFPFSIRSLYVADEQYQMDKKDRLLELEDMRTLYRAALHLRRASLSSFETPHTAFLILLIALMASSSLDALHKKIVKIPSFDEARPFFTFSWNDLSISSCLVRSSPGLSKIIPIAGLSFYVRALVLKSPMYVMTLSLLLSCLEVMV